MDFKGTGFEYVDLINATKDRVQLQVLVNTIIKFEAA
jgi:hypothetical protein